MLCSRPARAITIHHTLICLIAIIALAVTLFLAHAGPAAAYDLVKAHQKISYWFGGFAPGDTLDISDHFGTSIAQIGDIDGDGVPDLAISAPNDDGGGHDRGAVWILFMNSDETVKRSQKISDIEGNFPATINDGDNFGISMAALGDHDGDGIGDIVVGTSSDDDGGTARGAVRVIFLNSDGTVKDHQKISDLYGNFTGILDDNDNFGRSVASLGDLDGDGVGDIAVGAYKDDDGGSDRGAVWILFLNIDGTVKSYQKISDSEGNFTGVLDDYDYFSRSIVSLGTLDADTIPDLAVGANFDDDGGENRGAVYILFMNADGTVKSHQKISATAGNFTGVLDDFDHFGRAVAGLGDLDNDTVEDLAVGSYWDDDGGPNHGAVWVLFLNTDGTVKSHQKISSTQGNFTGDLDDNDYFGNATTLLGDIDSDGVVDMAVGAYYDGDGGLDKGACWILYLNSNGTVKTHTKISELNLHPDELDDNDRFGRSTASIGDLDDDGVTDLVVGVDGDDDGGSDRGAVYILLMNSDGSVKSNRKISGTLGGFNAVLDDGDGFGTAACGIGDLDNDGVEDIAVGAMGDDDGGIDRGAVYILFLNGDGSVKNSQKISAAAVGFTGVLSDNDGFGSAVTAFDDLDGDTIEDLAVGAVSDDGSGSSRGAVYVIFLNSNGTVKGYQKIGDAAGGFTGVLSDGDLFGCSASVLGDIDGDTIDDLGVGAAGDDDGGTMHGALWILFLNPNGTVKTYQKISDTQGGFTGALANGDMFGSAIVAPGDLNNDGITDIAAGAYGDDGTGIDRGAVWVLFLNFNGSVKAYQKINGSEGAFTGDLDDGDFFGGALCTPGDLDNNGIDDLVVGAINDDDGGTDRGAAWVIFLEHLLNCRVDPDTLEFGHVAIGESPEASLTIRNDGLETLNGSVSEACGDFSIVSGGGPYSLATDESLTVTIRFQPARIGSLSCTIETGDASCGDVACFGIVASALIDSVVDVPGDEGGWVRIFFTRSIYDAVAEPTYPISLYDINRRVDDPVLTSAVITTGTEIRDARTISRSGGEPLKLDPAMLGPGARCVSLDGRYFVVRPDGESGTAPPGVWEIVGNVSARQQDSYIYLAPTYADSAETIPYAVFYVSAHTTTPSVFFESPPDSGYSVDNTILCVPENFTVDYNTGSGNYLSWDPCLNDNFHYYAIYRGSDPDFVPVPSNQVHTTVDTWWYDPEFDGYDVHYKITSVTIDDKESPPASPITVTATVDQPVPDRFALYQNVPNPFNPVTAIQYDVPARGGWVTLRIYDVSGRLLATLVDGEETAGVKRVTWNGTDTRGRKVASGIYFYRLEAPGFMQTRKMVLVQ